MCRYQKIPKPVFDKSLLTCSVAILHSKSPVEVFLQLHESLSNVHSAFNRLAWSGTPVGKKFRE